MKINPYKMRPNADVVETRTFTDPKQPDDPITLTFTARSGADNTSVITQHVSELVTRYITGEGKDKPPVPVLIPGSRAIRITEKYIKIIAMLMDMETPQDGDEPYTFEEWAAIGAVMPTAFLGITNWMVELTDRVGESAGNESAASKD